MYRAQFIFQMCVTINAELAGKFAERNMLFTDD